MSEQPIPKPEQPVEPLQKFQATCWHCSHVVTSSLATCHTTVFSKQPWNSYSALSCPDKKCGAVTVLFHDQLPATTLARALQYPISQAEFCDEADTLAVRRQLVGAHDVTPHELSDRQQRVLAHWGAFLQRITVDITDFPEPPPRAYR